MITIRQQLAALLAFDGFIVEAVVSADTPYAGRFDWRRGDSVESLVGSLRRARCLRQALTVATFAAGTLGAFRMVAQAATSDSARAARHQLHLIAAGGGELDELDSRPNKAPEVALPTDRRKR